MLFGLKNVLDMSVIFFSFDVVLDLRNLVRFVVGLMVN